MSRVAPFGRHRERGCWAAWVLTATLALAPVAVAGQTADTVRTFSLDSRYVGRSYSNDAMAGFGIGLFNLATLPIQLIEPSSRLRNVGRGLLLLVESIFVGEAFLITYHEYGHGTRAAARGWRPRYGFGLILTDADLQAALQGPPEHETFFGFFFNSFGQGSAYALAGPDDLLFTPPSEDLVEDWAILLNAGGLNNEMLFAERIEDEISRNDGHIGFLPAYVNAKLSTIQYSVVGVFGDVDNTVRSYQAMGFDIDQDRIDSASRASFFLTSLSYQLIYQTVRMFTGESIRFTAWAPGGVELPNTSFFMTRSGLSYRVRTGYRTGPWRFPLAVESVFEGDGRTEVSLGAERHLARTYLRARATFGEALGVGLSADYRIRDKVALSAGYTLYDSRNLLGERLIPSLENGSRYHNLFVRLSFAY